MNQRVLINKLLDQSENAIKNIEVVQRLSSQFDEPFRSHGMKLAHSKLSEFSKLLMTTLFDRLDHLADSSPDSQRSLATICRFAWQIRFYPRIVLPMRLGELPSALMQGHRFSEIIGVNDDENVQKRSLEDPLQALQYFYDKLKPVY